MKFTKKSIEAIEATGKRQVFFDDDFTGFALRVSEAGRKSFYFTYRPGKGRGVEKKWVTLGSFPVMTVEQAKQKAKEMGAAVQFGSDPAQVESAAKKALTAKEALDMFYQEHVSTKLKKSSAKLYRGLIGNDLVPALGKLKVADIEHRHITTLHHAMRARPYMANRAIAVLSKFFSWAGKNGYRPQEVNPVNGLEKYKEEKRTIFMGAAELAVLGEILTKMEKTWNERHKSKKRRPGKQVDSINPQMAAAIRLLMFTGARLSEVLTLKWNYLDLTLGVARLPDSKTGFKVLQLPVPAVAVLNSLPQVSEWVFPADSASGHMVNIRDAWVDLCLMAELKGWRLHDLRHAFASMMVNSGASLPIIGKILGHSQVSTTARYAHLEQNPARKAAEDAAAKIAEVITGRNKAQTQEKNSVEAS